MGPEVQGDYSERIPSMQISATVVSSTERHAAIPIQGAEVEASGEFPAIGLAATNISYRATVHSSAPAADVERLLRETDAVAEVHNTIRSGVPVRLIQGG